MNTKIYLAVKEEEPVAVVRATDDYNYDCLNVTGNQVCIQGIIFEDPDKIRSWSSKESPVLGRKISNKFPLCLFFGKKAGDTVDLIFLNKAKQQVTVTVTLYVPGTKSFQDILYERTTGFGGVYDADYEDDLPRVMQYCMITAAHQQYADSVGKPASLPNTFRHSSGWIECMKEESSKKPKLSYIEKLTEAMNLNDKTPVERLGNAMLKVKEENMEE